MFKNFFTTKRICRAGVIAALYVALTYAFAPVAYQGIFQIRPGEALTILPLFFPEAIPALYIGCMLSNLASIYLIYDVFVGSLATLAASICTYFIGLAFRKYAGKGAAAFKIALGGIFPVLFNAFIIPLIIVFLYHDTSAGATVTIAYWTNFASMLLSEAVWIYGLGIPLYFFVERMRKKGVAAFSDGRKKRLSPPEPNDETPQPQA